MASRRTKHYRDARTISIPALGASRGRLVTHAAPPRAIDIPADAKVKIESYSITGHIKLSFWDSCGRKLIGIVMPENGLVSLVAAFHEMGFDTRDFLDDLILLRAEAGDLSPLITEVRKAMSPRLAQLVVDVIEKRHRLPAHRIQKPETYTRQWSIAVFIHERVDEGFSLHEAKGRAAQAFKVSKLTVRDAFKKFGKFV